jgi:hypothetical protein
MQIIPKSNITFTVPGKEVCFISTIMRPSLTSEHDSLGEPYKASEEQDRCTRYLTGAGS